MAGMLAISANKAFIEDSCNAAPTNARVSRYDGESELDHEQDDVARCSTGKTDSNLPFSTTLELSLSSTPKPRRAKLHGRHIRSPTSDRPRTPLSPDRFVTARAFGGNTRQAISINKSFRRLTPNERLLRRRTGLSDPFEENNYAGRLSSQYPPGRIQHGQPIEIRQLQGIIDLRDDRQLSAGHLFTHSFGSRSFSSNSGVSSQSGTHGVHDGRGRLLGSQTNAPIYTSHFFDCQEQEASHEAFQKRLALALEVDLANRLLLSTDNDVRTRLQDGRHSHLPLRQWVDSAWTLKDPSRRRADQKVTKSRRIPSVPFKVLDAPELRDDYYCSALAYSSKLHIVAVGLGPSVFLWSDSKVVEAPSQVQPRRRADWVSSLAFSNSTGGPALLAIGRITGSVFIYSPEEASVRAILCQMAHRAAHISFKPNQQRQVSTQAPYITVDVEILLVGDDTGTITVYCIEWPDRAQRDLYDWHGSAWIVARISSHSQQICGIAWSPHGDFFAAGGNDNLLCLYETRLVFAAIDAHSARVHMSHDTPTLSASDAKQTWTIAAAVKAIAFCPWQPGLLAAGGGSNDRCIHFYHTLTGACLAVIDCAAQVTSIVWSSTTRQVAATFGYAQPEHPYRIAVYAWPSCQQVAAVKWAGELRALYAISYPVDSGTLEVGRSDWRRDVGGDAGKNRKKARAGEGCIIVAASDATIKFHEVWSDAPAGAAGTRCKGLLGGSDILEMLAGIEKDGVEVIR